MGGGACRNGGAFLFLEDEKTTKYLRRYDLLLSAGHSRRAGAEKSIGANPGI
jgi:hypothetical protein